MPLKSLAAVEAGLAVEEEEDRTVGFDGVCGGPPARGFPADLLESAFGGVVAVFKMIVFISHGIRASRINQLPMRGAAAGSNNAMV